MSIKYDSKSNYNPDTHRLEVELNFLIDEVHNNAKEKGFHPEGQSLNDFINYQICNLYGEVAELHEAWRKGQLNKQCDKPVELTFAEEEYADIIIRAFDQCRRLNIDIVKAILIKHLYNTTRPYMHGGKLS